MTGFLSGSTWTQHLPTATPSLVSTVEITSILHPLPAARNKWAYLLILAAGRPVGWITCPVVNGFCKPDDIRHAVATTLAKQVVSTLLVERLRVPIREGYLSEAELFTPPHSREPRATTLVTVAVCTRDRPKDLDLCLASLDALTYPHIEVLVVDNASQSSETRSLVESRYPQFRYLREDKPGLDWARNAALRDAKGEIIAYTDDDVIVQADWVDRIAAVFEEEDVTSLAGLIAPYELRTPAQLHFEAIGGFGRGCSKYWYRVAHDGKRPDLFHLGSGRFGAGANMAFRTSALHKLGGFDPALDVGTATGGGGDLDVFFRVLHEGGTLVYEPAALVWHRHRDSAAALSAQLSTWGSAIGAVLTAAASRYPRFYFQILSYGIFWACFGYVGPALRNLLGPGRLPRRLRFLPLRRLLAGPGLYRKAKRAARRLNNEFNLPPAPPPQPLSDAIPIRAVDLAEPITDLSDVVGKRACEIQVFLSGKYIGSVTLHHRGHVVSAEELRFRIADHLLDGILDVGLGDSLALLRNIDELVFQAIRCSSREKEVPIDPSLVSIVVASRNRPERLARCLKSLCAQQTNFPVEIIVVDNDPASGLTRPVVKSFPGVRCVDEPVQGLAHARNTGFRAALGDILVATDDDVVTPGFWLREIVQPFRFAHIGVVTGQVVPLALDHEEQRAFEAQGGLGKGRQSFEVGIDWLAKNKWQPPRAWDLGATANAAFRRSLLADPAVGLLPETLGPGTPAGGGEDAYLFYRAVVTGYSVYYEAAAMLQHEHRSNAAALRRQMFDYARGHVSYLLTTVVRDRDFRALVRLVTVLPAWHLWRLLSPFIRLGYRRRIVAAEIAGFLVGPVSWLYSNARDWRLRHKGRTAWTKPVDEIPAAVIQTEMQ